MLGRIRQQVAEMECQFNARFEETEEKIEQFEQARAGNKVRKLEGWVGQVEVGFEKRMCEEAYWYFADGN